MNETIRNLIERRSIRKYKPEQIRDEELNAVLEAGMYAPSGRGHQSTLMVVVQDPETISMLSRMNAAIWGKANTDPFYGAPTVIVVLADTSRSTWVEDGSLVMGNLMNAAHALGLGSCWVHRARQVHETDAGRELLRKWGVPEGYAGVGNCILGYPDGEVPKAAPRKENFIIRV